MGDEPVTIEQVKNDILATIKRVLPGIQLGNDTGSKPVLDLAVAYQKLRETQRF